MSYYFCTIAVIVYTLPIFWYGQFVRLNVLFLFLTKKTFVRVTVWGYSLKNDYTFTDTWCQTWYSFQRCFMNVITGQKKETNITIFFTLYLHTYLHTVNAVIILYWQSLMLNTMRYWSLLAAWNYIIYCNSAFKTQKKQWYKSISKTQIQ